MRFVAAFMVLAAVALNNGCSSSSSAQGTGVVEMPGVHATFFARLNGDSVIFMHDDGLVGTEPWISDGTEAGTFALDVFPGPDSSMTNPAIPGAFVAFVIDDDTAYFLADDGINGRELWQTDGTLAGTQLVADLIPGPTGFAYQRDMIFHNNKLFLSGVVDDTDEAVMFVLDL